MKHLIKIIAFTSILFISTTSKGAVDIKMPATFKAEFEQVYKSAVRKKEIRKSGILEYSFPGKIKLETGNPVEVIQVANLGKTWTYQPPAAKGEPGELRIANGAQDPLLKLLDSLKKAQQSNSDFSIKTVENKLEITFSKEKSAQMGLKAATLVFTKDLIFSQLKEIEFETLRSGKKKIVFTKIEPQVKFSKNYFEFKAPKNTRVSK